MKLIRALLALASLFALCACSSWSPSHPFQFRNTKRPVAPVAPAPAPAAVPVVPESAPVETPAPAPVPAPAVVAPAPEPVVTPAPEPAPVVTTPSPLTSEPAPAPVLNATHSGSTVKLTWTLPSESDGYRAIEVMRNTASVAQGRGRIRAVRATVTGVEDTVPDTTARYWYWLKLTTANGTVSNIGPIEATESK